MSIFNKMCEDQIEQKLQGAVLFLDLQRYFNFS
uniref:Uncharacterized protein n=1 Tax=Arundo donax TaxID=35708 RepID=A0A0A9BHI5_ARUDO